ncbi:phage portal protein [Chelatococcus daeguensis]|uniref:Phage portal protein, lambda family n=1 Tax=Chelatococcus sambhunathii TaxID=363953 RepID=A0ABP2A8N9_9HYPH|nr:MULTISPECIES: phage portal protein [Chelatococcus]KZE34110.1 portal protein [Chelatococcus daeguensis]MBM3082667.1 phage portal protein [Chelatococcus daeguensis]CUA90903.1 phage portal protein, lambda family [Chelatococcus sambhunathii]
MGLIEKIRGAVGLPVTASPRRQAPSAAYMRGDKGIVMGAWRPPVREPRHDVADAYELAIGRALDVIQNSGWVAGIIDQAVANTVGEGLRLNSTPDMSAFGWDRKTTSAWARRVEQRFELWARTPLECDIECRRTFGQMQAATFRQWFATGEIVSQLRFKYRPGGQYGTKVKLLPPWWLSKFSNEAERIVQGVRMDEDGCPIAYIVRSRAPGLNGVQDVEFRARDSFGRPKLVHVFDGVAGQVRGITPLVPALRLCRQFDQLADATLMAALVQTVFAASIKSDEPTEDMLRSLLTPQEQARVLGSGATVFDVWYEAQAGWYDKSVIDVGINGRVAHLFPGQELQFHSPAHPTSHYKDFALHLLRELARCAGLTYESATGDYEGATYSSVRMAVNEIFAITRYRRKNVVTPFCQPAFEAWLEEEIESGGVDLPGGIEAFLANRTAICRAEWHGAAKPQADDLKTAKAHEIWKRLGVMTDEAICNDLGTDVEDVYAQRAREREMRGEYGLPEAETVEADPDADALLTEREEEDGDG